MRTINTNKQVWIYLSLILLIIVLIGIFIAKFISIFGYILIAVTLAYMITPILKKMEKYGVNRTQSFSMIIVLAIGISILTILIGIPIMKTELSQIQSEWPNIQERINNELLQETQINEQKYYHSPLLNMDFEAEKIDGYISAFASDLNTVISDAMTIVLKFLLSVPLVTYILVSQGNNAKKRILKSIPNKYFEMGNAILHNINKSISNFIAAKIIQTVILTIVASIGFTFIGLRLPILMGIIVGVINIIPYIGPLIGAIPPVAIAYLLMDYQTAIFAIIIIAIVQGVDNFFIQPVLLPKLVNENAVVVLIVTLLGAELFGAVGMVIAIPVFSIVKIILEKSYEALDFIYSRPEWDTDFLEQ